MISPPPPYERKESNKKIKAQQSKAQSRGAVRRPPSTRSLAGTPRFAAIRPAARHQGSRDVAEGRHVRCSGRAGSRRRLGMDGPPPSLFLSGNRCRRGRPPRWWRRTGGLRLQLFRKPSIFICISSRLRIEIETLRKQSSEIHFSWDGIHQIGAATHVVLGLAPSCTCAATGRRPTTNRNVDPRRPRPTNWGDEPGSRNAGSTPNSVTMVRPNAR